MPSNKQTTAFYRRLIAGAVTTAEIAEMGKGMGKGERHHLIHQVINTGQIAKLPPQWLPKNKDAAVDSITRKILEGNAPSINFEAIPPSYLTQELHANMETAALPIEALAAKNQLHYLLQAWEKQRVTIELKALPTYIIAALLRQRADEQGFFTASRTIKPGKWRESLSDTHFLTINRSDLVRDPEGLAIRIQEYQQNDYNDEDVWIPQHLIPWQAYSQNDRREILRSLHAPVITADYPELANDLNDPIVIKTIIYNKGPFAIEPKLLAPHYQDVVHTVGTILDNRLHVGHHADCTAWLQELATKRIQTARFSHARTH